MNAPARLDSTPRLEDFPYRLTDNVRFADLDPNQHVNNAVYATYFETGRVTLMKDRSYGLMPAGVTWIMVRLDMHFRAELRWPGTIEMGLGVCEIRPDLRDLRSGGVFRRPMRRIGAVGLGTDRRGDAQADAADRGDHREIPALAVARRGSRAAEIRAFGEDGPRVSFDRTQTSRPAAPASRPRGRRVRR